MDQAQSSLNRWKGCRIGITGANGSLGKALTKRFIDKGAFVIGLTHRPITNATKTTKGSQEWISWQCGQENAIEETLKTLDILVLNHGINPQGQQSSKALNEAIEVNALSCWRLMTLFENIAKEQTYPNCTREIWVNTSEAEIQPALSPGYEISKKLIGELVSIRWNNLKKEERARLQIRKLVLGPFLSELNPLGIMSADFVAKQIINQVELGLKLIIITPNPITYIMMPLNEILRTVYSKLINKIYTNS